MRNVKFYDDGDDCRIEIAPVREPGLVVDRVATPADLETYRKELAAYEAAKNPKPPAKGKKKKG